MFRRRHGLHTVSPAMWALRNSSSNHNRGCYAYCAVNRRRFLFGVGYVLAEAHHLSGPNLHILQKNKVQNASQGEKEKCTPSNRRIVINDPEERTSEVPRAVQAVGV